MKRDTYRVVRQSSAAGEADRATVGIPVPAPDPGLFRHTVTNDAFRFLLDNPYEQFTIREFGCLTDTAAQSVRLDFVSLTVRMLSRSRVCR